MPIVGLLLGLFVVIVAGGLVAGYLVVRSQYYVGETTDGKVAIFRGMNDSVLGFKLYSVYKPTNIPVSGIPEASANELKQAATGSLTQAERFLGNHHRAVQHLPDRRSGPARVDEEQAH